MKKLLILIMLMFIPAVMAGTITRSFSSNSITTGATLTIDYTASGVGPFIRQPIPTGWTIIDNGGGVYNGGILRLQGAPTITLQAPTIEGDYDFDGDYIIDGATVWVDFVPKTETVSVGAGGDTHNECSGGSCILVAGAGVDECTIDDDCTICTPSDACKANTCIGSTCTDSCGNTYDGEKTCGCTSSWDCTSWTTCSNDKQTRTCTDLNNCENDKIETKTCTIDKQCGDNTCDDDESCTSCEEDCGKCTTETDCLPYIQDKIDGVCEFNKTATTLFYVLIFLFFIQFIK